MCFICIYVKGFNVETIFFHFTRTRDLLLSFDLPTLLTYFLSTDERKSIKKLTSIMICT